MDTMLKFQNDALCQFMTKDEIRSKAPYIFAKEPTNPNVSKKYVHASTETIIDDMEKLGWGVVDCKQQRPNKRSNIRSFHMVAFQNPNVFITKDDENGNSTIECFPRIIITNSHDGFKSFKFMVGLFRLICSNGLIIATETFADISIRHINYTFEELRGVVAKAITCVSDNVSVMQEMQDTKLTDEQARSLATEAIKIRKGKKDDVKFSVPEDELTELLEPTRKEDEGGSLWDVFNILQEKIIKGSFVTTSKTNGKKRKARPITGVAKDIEVNQEFFKVASSYRMAA